jgi:hypothetical protein
MNDVELAETVYKITSMNRCWKRALDNWSDDSPIANMLRLRKSSLQVYLLREHPGKVSLKLDRENDEGELLYSVRLSQPVTLPNGVTRRDADHLPVRIAESLLSKEEIDSLVQENNQLLELKR